MRHPDATASSSAGTVSSRGGDAAGEHLSSIKTIDQMGEFVQDHAKRAGRPGFGAATSTTASDRAALVTGILPYLRGAVSSNRRVIAHYDGGEDATTFANAKWTSRSARWGRAARITSCARASRHSTFRSTRQRTS